MYFDGRTLTYNGREYSVGANGFYQDENGGNSYAMTIPVGNGESEVYFSPAAMKSGIDLFVTMGHEFVHVYNNFYLGNECDKMYSENAAYNWTLEVSKANGWDDWKQTAVHELQKYYQQGDSRYFKYNLPSIP